MAETQRQPVPRNDGGERDTALAFLAFARGCVIKKTEGLSDGQLRQVMVDSGTSLLGLVQHLADAERYWFGYHVGGIGVDDYDFSMEVPGAQPRPADGDPDGRASAHRALDRRPRHDRNHAARGAR